MLWMAGGPSHVDTFDPKPKADTKIKGPFEAVETNVSGVFIGEHLPKLARQMDKMAILRSVSHGDGAHERAEHYMQTGYLPLPTLEFPSYGSVIAHEKGVQNNLPAYMQVLGGANGQGAGFLGGSFNPFYAGNPGDPNYRVGDLQLPGGVTQARLDRRRRLLGAIDSLKGAKSDAIKSMDTFTDRAYGLVTSKAVAGSVRAGQRRRQTARRVRAQRFRAVVPAGPPPGRVGCALCHDHDGRVGHAHQRLPVPAKRDAALRWIRVSPPSCATSKTGECWIPRLSSGWASSDAPRN